VTKVHFFVLFSFFLLLFSSCDFNSTQSDAVRSDVEGTFYIDLPAPRTDGIFPASESFSIDDLEGSVFITVGNAVQVVWPSALTYDSNNNRLKVPLSITVEFEGMAVITCVSRLFYEKQPEPQNTKVPFNYAGYLITRLEKDTVNRINDTDNDDSASSLEKDTTPLIPAIRFYEPTSFVPTKKPEGSLDVTNLVTNKLVTEITGTVSNLDWALVYVRVNNQYQWIETVEATVTAGQVSFPKETDTPVVVPLKPGTNEIQLFAVNSQGLTVSPIKEVECTAKKDKDKENLLVTLTWDTFADLDLHTWYYSEERGEAVWHNYYFQKDVPESDGITNLDADRKTGFGPEHFTLLGADDGYYVIAVNAYSSQIDAGSLRVNAFVTIETNNKRHSLGPFTIRQTSEEKYPVNNSHSWARIKDIRIENGKATLLDPNRTIEPPSLTTSPNSSLVDVNAQKWLIKNR